MLRTQFFWQLLTNVTPPLGLSIFLKTYYVENLLKHPSDLSQSVKQQKKNNSTYARKQQELIEQASKQGKQKLFV